MLDPETGRLGVGESFMQSVWSVLAGVYVQANVYHHLHGGHIPLSVHADLACTSGLMQHFNMV